MVLLKFPRALSGCHINEIWDKMDYNLASVKDISKIFASNGLCCVGGRAVEWGQSNSTTTDLVAMETKVVKFEQKLARTRFT